jgi:hypothetical protein
LLSSVIPRAAAVAEYWVSLPACSAASRSASDVPGAGVRRGRTADMLLSKSAAALIAYPAMPVRAIPGRAGTVGDVVEVTALGSLVQLWPTKSFVAAPARLHVRLM